jgi:hypothetical protein
VLPDGSYDAIVIDAVDDGGIARLELTILAGEHKGEVVNLASPNLAGDPSLLLGVPATITVDGGAPKVELEP